MRYKKCIKNVFDIKTIFYGYTSLKILPNISKLETHNLENISGICDGCNSYLNHLFLLFLRVYYI